MEITSTLSDFQSIDWKSVDNNLTKKGYALLPKFLSWEECHSLSSLYTQQSLYRKTVSMERHRYGKGEYKYFNYPLPTLIARIRAGIYPYLVPIANDWMIKLKSSRRYPKNLSELHHQCKYHNQTKATPLILKYGPGGYNTLHQDLYGEIYFPIQLVLFLSSYEEDYTGGEFVMTEQVPRAQSKAIVLKPNKGDALLFTTQFRPIMGTKGYYKVQMRHGVSEVLSGNRSTLGIIFHDAVK